jgi:hypothetical protein
MTKEERMTNFKYNILQHARKHNNITYSCIGLNIPRFGCTPPTRHIYRKNKNCCIIK